MKNKKQRREKEWKEKRSKHLSNICMRMKKVNIRSRSMKEMSSSSIGI